VLSSSVSASAGLEAELTTRYAGRCVKRSVMSAYPHTIYACFFNLQNMMLLVEILSVTVAKVSSLASDLPWQSAALQGQGRKTYKELIMTENWARLENYENQE